MSDEDRNPEDHGYAKIFRYDWDLKCAIRNQTWLHMPDHTEVVHDAYKFYKYVNTHPLARFDDEKKRITMPDCQERRKTPGWAQDQVIYMKKLFRHNVISLVIFAGLNDESESLPIHKDEMDVFYIHAFGKINWQIFEAEDEETLTFDTVLKPGDAMWIPRGTYHRVIQSEPRIGYSFGCEGHPPPHMYV